MGKSSGSPPPAPDPAKLAAMQGAEDRKSIQYGLNQSRTSTVNPFGSSSWRNNKSFDQTGWDAAMAAYKPAGRSFVAGTPGVSGTGGGGAEGDGDSGRSGTAGSYIDTPEVGTAPDRSAFEKDSWTNDQTLSAGSQGIYDDATKQLGDLMGGEGGYSKAMSDAIFSRMRRFQDPADALARSGMQSNLADRGFQVGNEGYDNEMDRLDNSQGMGRADAADRATIGGMTEGRAQIAALQALRNAQVAGVSGMPSTTSAPGAPPVPIAGMMMDKYGSDMDAYNAEQASDDAMFGTLLSLGGTMMGMPMLGTMAGAAAGAMKGGGGKRHQAEPSTRGSFYRPNAY